MKNIFIIMAIFLSIKISASQHTIIESTDPSINNTSYQTIEEAKKEINDYLNTIGTEISKAKYLKYDLNGELVQSYTENYIFNRVYPTLMNSNDIFGYYNDSECIDEGYSALLNINFFNNKYYFDLTIPEGFFEVQLKKDHNNVNYFYSPDLNKNFYVKEKIFFETSYKFCTEKPNKKYYSYNFKIKSSVDSAAQSCQTLVGNPCDVATGNKFQTEIDINNRIPFIRYYNSNNKENYISTGLVGWTHNYSDVIPEQNLESEVIHLFDGSYKKIYYKKKNKNEYFSLTNNGNYLNIIESQNEIYEKRDNVTNVYDLKSGKLKRILSSNSFINLIYNEEVLDKNSFLTKVENNLGDELIFNYKIINNKKVLTTIENSGLIVSLNSSLIEENNILNSIEKNNKIKTYHYEDINDQSLLTGITDENGIRYNTWLYDNNGLAIYSSHPDGFNEVSISATRDSYTNSKNEETKYNFNKKEGQFLLLNKLEDTKSTPLVTYHPEYSNSVLTIEKDISKVNFTYSDYNQIIKEEYFDSNNLIEENIFEYSYINEIRGGFNKNKIKNNKLETIYNYEKREDRQISPYISEHNWLPISDIYEQKINRITYVDKTNNVYPYSTYGNTKEIKFDYHPTNYNLILIDGARNDVNDKTYFKYDNKGRLIGSYSSECISQFNEITKEFTINISNECKYIVYSDFTEVYYSPQVINKNGYITYITYDIDNNITSVKNINENNEIVTNYEYDNLGQITKITLPNGNYLEYEYNSARYLTKIKNSINEQIDMNYDKEGMLIERKIKSTSGEIIYQQNNVYSNTNNLIKSIIGETYENSFLYDDRDRLKEIVNHLGNSQKINYDGLNRITKEIDLNEGEVSREYDNQLNKETISDQKGNITTYYRDGFNNIIGINSPDTGNSVYYYDLAGNLIKKIDSMNNIIEFEYDNLNRLLKRKYDGKEEIYTYDQNINSLGKLSKINFNNNEINYEYNQLELKTIVKNKINNNYYNVEYFYNNYGKLNKIKYPSGLIVNYNFDSLNRINSISIEKNNETISIINNVVYSANGNVLSFIYGNGVEYTSQYNKSNQITEIKNSGISLIIDEKYTYENIKQIKTIVDNIDNSNNEYFYYNKKSELIGSFGKYGQLNYEYDSVGNRTKSSKNIIEESIYNYDINSNKLLSIQNNNEIRNMSYDNNGNLIIDENDNLIYNKNNKLVQFNNIVYEYNPLGQRIIEGDNKNIYSEEGNLIHVNNPNYTIDYIYFNDIKISMIKDDFIDYNVYFAHNNYIGLPKVFTDMNQNIAWKGIFTPFGELFEETGNINNNIRYIGQYANIESEYFYNYHRDYDPTIGRYIQSDPIGLNGGMNTYAYALSNPTNYTDKFGLDITIENVYAPEDNENKKVVENFHLNVGVKGKKRYTFAIYDTYQNGDELIFGGGYAGLTGTFKDGVIKIDTFKFREENKILISNEVLDNNIERLLESLLGNNGDYALFTNNCRTFSKEIFNFASDNKDILEKNNFSSQEILDMYKKYYL